MLELIHEHPALVTMFAGLALAGLSVIITLAAQRYGKGKQWAIIAQHLSDALARTAFQMTSPEIAALRRAAENGSFGVTERKYLDKWLGFAIPWLKRTPAGELLLTAVDAIDPKWQTQLEDHVCTFLNNDALHILLMSVSFKPATATFGTIQQVKP